MKIYRNPESKSYPYEYVPDPEVKEPYSYIHDESGKKQVLMTFVRNSFLENLLHNQMCKFRKKKKLILISNSSYKCITVYKEKEYVLNFLAWLIGASENLVIRFVGIHRDGIALVFQIVHFFFQQTVQIDHFSGKEAMTQNCTLVDFLMSIVIQNTNT